MLPAKFGGSPCMLPVRATIPLSKSLGKKSYQIFKKGLAVSVTSHIKKHTTTTFLLDKIVKKPSKNDWLTYYSIIPYSICTGWTLIHETRNICPAKSCSTSCKLVEGKHIRTTYSLQRKEVDLHAIRFARPLKGCGSPVLFTVRKTREFRDLVKILHIQVFLFFSPLTEFWKTKIK